MNGPAMVAEHLDDRTDALIGLWRESLRRSGDVPRSDSLTRTEFEDHVPTLLDRMADRLRGHEADVADVAEKHGHMRWRQGYDVAEVVSELGHLRTALVQATFAYARDNDFDLATLEAAHSAIHEVLNEATAESVRQFQEDSEDQTQRALDDLRDRSRAVEVARRAAEAERGKVLALLESLPVGVWVADADGRIAAMNREAEILQQFPADRTIGQINIREQTPLFEMARTDGMPYRSEDLPLSRALRGEVIRQEEMHWSQPGGARAILASASPLRDPDAAVVGAVVIAQDITARKRLESDLRDTSAQLRGIVEQSPVLIWKTDTAGAYSFVNRTFLDFFGMSGEEARSLPWEDAVHPDDRAGLRESFASALSARSHFAHEFRVRPRDGQVRWLSSRGVPLFDDREEFLGYLGTALDVTDRHELEAILERQRATAEESSKHKTRLLAALSHDARTPLNAVALSAQLLEMHVHDSSDPEVAECLRTIRNGVRNVLDLLNDLLNLTRIDAGVMPVEPSRFSLADAVTECVSSIETPARLKGLDFRMEPDGLVGMTVETDRAKLKQILANFLSNALRYTERGQIRLAGSVLPGQVRIAVKDTGIGIAPADQARIFDEFATLEGPRRAKEEGTGLGLAICRRLALMLGGEILVDSAPGRGSTFTLALPDSIVVADAGARPEAPAQATPDALSPIVVAEDHPDSRRTLARVLRRLGYRVEEAADGEEALELARSERPLAVLMDVNMPGMDGIDATLALRAHPTLHDVPIFALTGDVSVDNQRRIDQAGVQGYLEKPVTTESLQKALRTLVPGGASGPA